MSRKNRKARKRKGGHLFEDPDTWTDDDFPSDTDDNSGDDKGPEVLDDWSHSS